MKRLNSEMPRTAPAPSCAAIRLLGAARIITTVDIFLLSIRAGLLTVEEADAAKAVLAANRFTVVFGSFAELLNE
jgi:hypothetical protein